MGGAMPESKKIAPGIYFKEDNGRYSLVLMDRKTELIAWDYEEIRSDYYAWYSSLKAVALATQHGPSIAKSWINKKKTNSLTSVGSLLCNICNQQFVAESEHPYAFIANLGGKKFNDLQCSELCNKLRRQQVYSEETSKDINILSMLSLHVTKNILTPDEIAENPY